MSRDRAAWVWHLLAILALVGCSDDTTGSTQDTGNADAGGEDTADTGEDTAPDTAVDTAEDTRTDTSTDTTTDTPEDTDVADVPPFENDFPEVDRTVPQEGVSPTGSDDVLAMLEAGQVRAGVVVTSDFGGVEADCRPGDFKIYNAQVMFCIAGPTALNQFLYSGGQVMDADRVGADNDRFFLMVPHAQLNVGGLDAIEVLADGSEGSAVVEVRGPEEPVRILADEVGNIIPYKGVSFVTEYRLRPDVDYLEVVTWVKMLYRDQNTELGDLVLFGNTSLQFTPAFGRDRPDNGVSYNLVAGTGEGRSYGVYDADGMVNISLDLEGIIGNAVLPFAGMVEHRGGVPMGEEGVIRRYLIVGDGGTAEIRETIATIEGGTPLPEQTATITALEGEDPVAGELLVISDSEGHPLDLVLTDEAGVAEVALDPGSYVVNAENWAGGAAADVAFEVVAGDGAVAELVLPVHATLSLEITSQDQGPSEPSPAKVQLFGATAHLFFVYDGLLEEPLPEGTYQLAVTRGEEYDAYVEDIELVAGETLALEIDLEHVMDTDGYISGEFHQHMTNSPDSRVTEVDRLLTNVVEGVDFVVPSDHEAVTNLTPHIEALDLSDLIYAMPATEVSPIFTHFNPMPMPWDPALPAMGGFPKAELLDNGRVRMRSFPEMVEDLRANYGVQVIQINHPRGGGAALFDYAGYDPVDGPDEARRDRFTMDFDSVEVFNNRGNFCLIFADWASFVARGLSVTGVGNSDTHSIGGPAGYPRNYLVSDATPATMTDDDIISALLEGRVSVSGGAFIDFPEGPVIGDTLDVSAEVGTFDLHVRVQTPTWAAVESLMVVVDNEVVQEIALDEAADVVVDFDETIEVEIPSRDSYIVLVAYGTEGMPVDTRGEEPFGFTNPIYLEVDGEEGWTPPGVASDEDVVQLAIPWCD